MAAKKRAAKKSVFKRVSTSRVRGSTAASHPALVGAVEASAFLEALDGPLTFGGHLRAVRQGEELSLESFARKLGVTRMYLSDVELGRRSVSLPRAAQWANLLGYAPEQFVRLALQGELDEAGLDLEVTVTSRRTAYASTRRPPRTRQTPAHAS